MNAIANTIKAAQDTETARLASEAAKTQMQTAVYAEARARVAGLINEFNSMPMELKRLPGHERTSVPLHDDRVRGNEYRLLGKGLRFFLVWTSNGTALSLVLNAKNRFATLFARREGTEINRLRLLNELENGDAFMTIEEANLVGSLACGFNKTMATRIVGFIIPDGGFVIEKGQINCTTLSPAEWMTAIVSSSNIAPYVVISTTLVR